MKENTDKTWMEVHGGFAKDKTLRDEFAMRAMQGMIANNGTNAEVLVRVAYKMADAMLAAREGK